MGEQLVFIILMNVLFLMVNAEGKLSPAPSYSFEYNINRTSPRIVNIDENHVLVYYNAENFCNILALFQSHSLVVRSKQVDSLYIKAD